MNPFCLRSLVILSLLVLPTHAVWSVESPMGTAELSLGTRDVAEAAVLIDEISVKDVDIRDVIELIARKGGLNVVTGQDVKGKATIFLRDVDPREALRIVLEANGMAFTDDGNIIRVMTAAEYKEHFGHAFGEDKVTKMIKVRFVPMQELVALLKEMKSEEGKVIANEEAKSLVLIDAADKVRAMESLVRELDVQTVAVTIPLKYAKAQDVLDEVRGMLTQSVGSVECDVQENSLLVTDTLPKISKIKLALEQLDARGRRVVIDAKLVHVVLGEEHLGGVDWSGIVEDYRNIRLWNNYDFLDGEAQDRVLSLGRIEDGDFSTLLDALGTVGIVKEYPLNEVVISQDEAARLVVDMDEPMLDVSRVRADQVSEEGTPAAGGAASLVFFVEVSVDGEGKLEVRVIPQEPRSRQKNVREDAHTADISVDDGNTVVLGGIIATEKVATTHKIPLMGDLPILGFAFRFSGSSVSREEFIVFLSPKLLKNEAPGKNNAEEDALSGQEGDL